MAFDPEAFVDVAYALLEESGARLRLYTWFAGVAMAEGAAADHGSDLRSVDIAALQADLRSSGAIV